MNNLKRRIEELEDNVTEVEKEAFNWTSMNASRIQDLRDRLEALADHLGVEFAEVVPPDKPIRVQPKKEGEKE